MPACYGVMHRKLCSARLRDAFSENPPKPRKKLQQVPMDIVKRAEYLLEHAPCAQSARSKSCLLLSIPITRKSWQARSLWLYGEYIGTWTLVRDRCWLVTQVRLEVQVEEPQTQQEGAGGQWHQRSSHAMPG